MMTVIDRKKSFKNAPTQAQPTPNKGHYSEIKMLDLITNQTTMILESFKGWLQQLIYIRETGTFYWTDVENDGIFSKTKDSAAINTIIFNVDIPIGLVIDIEKNELYFSDRGMKGVFAFSLIDNELSYIHYSNKPGRMTFGATNCY